MFEGMVIGMHRGGVARDVHGAQGVVRPGRRAHLPAALADHRPHRGAAVGARAPRQAVLPARPEGQGRAHEGTEEGLTRCGSGKRHGQGPGISHHRERHPADGVQRRRGCGRGRARVPGRARSWRQPSCSIPIATWPGSAIRRRSRRSSASASTTKSRASPVAWCGGGVRVRRDRSHQHPSGVAAGDAAGGAGAGAVCRTSCSSTRSGSPICGWRSGAVMHGDARCTAIAAASIVAKVTRDRMMLELHARDPRYGFDRHKGYATRDHLDAVSRVRLLGRAPAVVPAAIAV